MSKNEVILSFDKVITDLCFFPYGESVYQNQVRGKIDLEKDFTIVFPKHIDDVAASFIQGFFKEIVEEIGVSMFKERAKIITGKELLTKKMYDNVY